MRRLRLAAAVLVAYLMAVGGWKICAEAQMGLGTLPFGASSFVSWTLGASAVQVGSNATTTTTPGISTSQANLVIVDYFGSVSNPTITDSNSASFTLASLTTALSGSGFCGTWYLFNPTTPLSSYTVTQSGGAHASLTIEAWLSKRGPGLALDGHTGAFTASGTTLNTGNITPGLSGELVHNMTGMNAAQTLSPTGSLGTMDKFGNYNVVGLGIADGYYVQPVATTVTQTFTYDTTTGACSRISSFKGAP